MCHINAIPDLRKTDVTCVQPIQSLHQRLNPFEYPIANGIRCATIQAKAGKMQIFS